MAFVSRDKQVNKKYDGITTSMKLFPTAAVQSFSTRFVREFLFSGKTSLPKLAVGDDGTGDVF